MNIEQAREALDNMDDYAKMDISIDAIGARKILTEFINEVEDLLKHNSIKQVPALFKEKK